MKTNYDSMDEAFEALINYVQDNDEDSNEFPEVHCTARPTSENFDFRFDD